MTTLDKLANQINQAFEDADYYAGEANQSRINAGRLLLEAHDKFHEWRLATINRGVDGVPSWKTWCDGKIKKANGEPRSWSDIKKVMALARAPDPTAALDAERSARNASMAKSRIRKAQGSHVGASAKPASHPIPKTLWVVTARADDGEDGWYEVFADCDVAIYWAYDLEHPEPYVFKITEEPASNFILKGWMVTHDDDDDDRQTGHHMMLVQRALPNVAGGPERVEGAVPGKIVRDYLAEEPAPAPPPAAPAPPPQASTPQPSSPKVTEQAARAQQSSARAQEPTNELHQECLSLVQEWLSSNPPAADIRAVVALIKSLRGPNPPRPSEQPGATVH